MCEERCRDLVKWERAGRLGVSWDKLLISPCTPRVSTAAGT